ncbi:MAG: hypothetical protein KGO53_07465 [Alphaproteobacteria bacterium]|nr:hypothetical protein [Alphaproteobacteria bacterium]
MSITKVVSFPSEAEFPNRLPPFAGGGGSETPSSVLRFRQALQDQAPAETLMGQLRDIITGPQARLSEARFEEMLDILEEQKDAATARLDVLEENLGEAVHNASRMTGLLEDQQHDIFALTRKLDDTLKHLRDEQDAALDKLRADLQLGMEMMSDSFKGQVEALEMNMRGGLLDLSSSLVVHIAEEDKRWDRERESARLTLDQRIAQWRAEMEDGRREDREEIANSMVDIGQRLLALRKN